MEIRKFEDLEVWQESMNLSTELHNELMESRHFSLRNQILRCSISIPSNIAEGFERQTNKEFIQHLYIAKGSCGELRTQLHLCKTLGVIVDARALEFIERTRKISAMLVRLIRTRYERF
jgi:four helix bundle protein